MSSNAPLLLWDNRIPDDMAGVDSSTPTITPFALNTAEPTAAVIVIPGGGYLRRAPHERAPIARWLNQLGLASFVLDYRVSPNRHPIPLFDAQRAIRWVRSNAVRFGVDASRVGILGFSAGGHLAATASTRFDGGNPVAVDPVEKESSRPDAAILCYPVISFIDECRHAGTMVNLLGPDPENSRRRELSAELQVGPLTPPTFLMHTAEDEGVPVRNSLIYAEALTKYHVPFSLHVYPNGAHGIGLAKEAGYSGRWTEACAGWLEELGFLP